MYPARTSSLWLGTSASAGSSRSVRTNRLDIRRIMRRRVRAAAADFDAVSRRNLSASMGVSPVQAPVTRKDAPCAPPRSCAFLAAVGTAALAGTLLASPASARPAITLTPGAAPRADVRSRTSRARRSWTAPSGSRSRRRCCGTRQVRRGVRRRDGQRQGERAYLPRGRRRYEDPARSRTRSRPCSPATAAPSSPPDVNRKSNATIKVCDVATATQLAHRAPSPALALDVDADRVLVGGARQTVTLDDGTGRSTS